jgi:hypothetical protein
MLRSEARWVDYGKAQMSERKPREAQGGGTVLVFNISRKGAKARRKESGSRIKTRRGEFAIALSRLKAPLPLLWPDNVRQK